MAGTLLALWVGLGCGSPPPPRPAAQLTHPGDLCTGARTTGCVEPIRVEAWLDHPDLRIVGVAEPHRGIQGTRVLTLSLHDQGEPVVFRAKWRPYTPKLVGYSEPRFEVVAYAMQRELVPPARYVLPPTVGRCFDLSTYRAIDAGVKVGTEGMSCVWGSLSYWLEDGVSLEEVEDEDWFELDGAYDPTLFERNRFYRDAISFIDLITYLTHNGDAHAAQFLMRPSPADPHVFMIDGSSAFGAKLNPGLFATEWDWTRVLVPLPEDAVARVFAWTEEDLSRLRSVERYRNEATGVVKQRDPWQPIDWPQQDGMIQLGKVFHVGLADDEIEALRARIEVLRTKKERCDVTTIAPRTETLAPLPCAPEPAP